MSANKKHRKLKKPVKILLIFSSLLLVVSLSVGVTYAYLLSFPDGVTNTFKPASTKIDIKEEKFDKQIKENVCVENNGDTSVFVRAYIVVTWQNENGDIYPAVPLINRDYTIELSDDNSWFQKEGFYYYSEEVAPGGTTSMLIKSCYPNIETTPDGYGLNVEIISSSIQSMPRNAVNEAWNVYSTSSGHLKASYTNS